MIQQGLYSPSGKMCYFQISWSLEAVGLDIMIIVSPRNLSGISAAYFKAIGKA